LALITHFDEFVPCSDSCTLCAVFPVALLDSYLDGNEVSLPPKGPHANFVHSFVGRHRSDSASRFKMPNMSPPVDIPAADPLSLLSEEMAPPGNRCGRPFVVVRNVSRSHSASSAGGS